MMMVECWNRDTLIVEKTKLSQGLGLICAVLGVDAEQEDLFFYKPHCVEVGGQRGRHEQPHSDDTGSSEFLINVYNFISAVKST